MSEFPFAEPAVAADGYDDAEAGSKRTLLIGGLAAALVVGAGGFFLLSGGGEEEVFTAVKRAPRAGAAAAPAPPTKIPAVFAAPVGRDPFRALYTVPVAAPAAPAAPAVTTPVTVIPVGGAPAAPPSGGQPPAQPAPAPVLHSLVLKSVTQNDARSLVVTFLIDGSGVTTQVGETFGPSKEIVLVSVQQATASSPWTATLKVGDGSPFTVATGEKVFVQ